MEEYISKEEINRVLLNRIGMNNKCLSGARESKYFEEEKYFYTLILEDEQIKALIEESAPSADVRENIHGHWIEHKEHCESIGAIPSGLGAYKWCSNCDCGIDVREWHRSHYNFCPNCGADMREPKGEKGK